MEFNLLKFILGMAPVIGFVLGILFFKIYKLRKKCKDVKIINKSEGERKCKK